MRGEMTPVAYALARQQARDRADEFFGLLDEYLKDPEFDACEAAKAAAEHTGIPWHWQPNIGHLNVCVDPVPGWQRRIKRRSWQLFRRRFTSIGQTYYVITHDYRRVHGEDSPFGPMRPMSHEYGY